MRAALLLIAIPLVFAGPALGQAPAATPPAASAEAASIPVPASPSIGEAPNSPYAISVETLTLEKAKGKTFEAIFSVGGFIFASQTAMQDKSGPFALEVLGAAKAKKLVSVNYRFTTLDNTPIAAGRCTMTTKQWSGLWNSADNSLYICQIEGISASDGFAFEAIIPPIEAQTGAFLSIYKDNPDKYKILKARMQYKGDLYEAVPTGFDLKNEAINQRVATGYTITREGKLVGRIDFPNLRKGFSDFGGSLDRKSVITAPSAEADGREAVIFFASQLLRLPEANSPALKAPS